jgi:hypothetical protein
MSRICIVKRAGLICASLVLLSPIRLFAQANVGSVAGSVSDSSGAVIDGAAVTLLNPATGEKSSTVSNSVGEYLFPMVRPATYTHSGAWPRWSFH